ncbi:DNA methyltransferase [Bacillus cereus]|uniref:site-specific DNA-methyltransferase (cytosine-N(4)-specific) n=1 Tax=Bacillus cereus TaxID=1396 RepID=A0A5B9HVY2_BACCE|nr:DNA methyltransferase [Bacillus cereus]QEF20273.1 site-specific DNA-methyltransferase [Bacillus cereus]
MKESKNKKEKLIWGELNLDYSGENNYASFLSSTSNVHSYPAKAVPNMIFDLLENISNQYKVNSVLDPFVGSGTTAVEAKYMGIDFYGSDLNPLAILLSRTKVLNLTNPISTMKTIKDFLMHLQDGYDNAENINMVSFQNIEYWFKKKNIRELSYLKSSISEFLIKRTLDIREEYALILCTAFSSTIRMSSLSRNSEFKLYRMSPSDIEKFSINSIDIFINNVNNIINMLEITRNVYKNNVHSTIELDNAKHLKFLKDKKVDFILTSPPYGDSRSTVAYGQFSRLSLQWMSDLMNEHLNIKVYSENCDEYLLGGKKSEFEVTDDIIIDKSKNLRELVLKMDNVIDNELAQLQKMKKNLVDIQNTIFEGKDIALVDIRADLLELIRERIRLRSYRHFNGEASYTIKEVRTFSIEETNEFFDKLFAANKKSKLEALNTLEEILPSVMETIKRKIKSVSRRKEEVLNFFKDLYQVVLRTNEVLRDKGVQAWIVGHRTVLGKININMMEILNDWFINIGYQKITDLTREYSFKRLPYHINSTINRNEQIQTMMQEYILIVQK